MAYKPPAVVLGGSTTGLGVVRSLAPKGIRAIVVDSNPNVTCFYSNQCEKRISPAESKMDAAADFLVSLGKELGKRAVLFPTSDAWLEVLFGDSKRLSRYFLYDFIPEKRYRGIMDKKRLYSTAEGVGVSCPRTIPAEGEGEAKQASKELRYPVLVKPVESAEFFSRFCSKGFICRNANELMKNYGKAKDAGFGIMLQEIIEGSDSELYSFCSYINKNGKALAIFTGRKLRQHPPDFGTCALGESLKVPELFEPSLKLLKALGYAGISQVEYKRGKDGKFYLMEVNPRIWLWHSLSTYCGASVALAAYRTLAGEDVEPVSEFREHVKWWDAEKDWQSFRILNRQGRLGWVEWLGSVRGEKDNVWFNPDDPLLAARKITGIAARKLGLLQNYDDDSASYRNHRISAM